MVLQLGSCISGEQRALGVLLYSAKYYMRPSASKGSTSRIDFSHGRNTLGSPECWVSLYVHLCLGLGRFNPLNTCPAAVLEQSKGTWDVVRAHAQAASHWLGILSHAIVTASSVECLKPEEMGCRQDSVEIDIHHWLICLLAFWFVTERGYTPESRLRGCGSSRLPYIPMGFLGGYIMLPLYLGCLCMMKAFPILQTASEKLLLNAAFVLVKDFC